MLHLHNVVILTIFLLKSILREINFGRFQSLKTDISTILEALSFDFDAFIQYLTEIVQNRF